MEISLEICTDNIMSVVNAAAGGADRIELCQELSVGGLTPSAGLIMQAKMAVEIPVFVLIRPRSGDFCYKELEIRTMEDDIKSAIQMGANGFVIGALTSTREVDVEVCRRLLGGIKNMPVTFHRAFDLTPDPLHALQDIMHLKFNRLLTSGQSDTAMKGLPLIQTLIEKVCGKMVVMAGCGITPDNLEEFLDKSIVQEIHSSAKTMVNTSNSPLWNSVVQGTSGHLIVDAEAVKKMKKILLMKSEKRQPQKVEKYEFL